MLPGGARGWRTPRCRGRGVVDVVDVAVVLVLVEVVVVEVVLGEVAVAVVESYV